MNPDDVARILDELGGRLGPAGEYVFALAVRQVYVDALVATVFLVLSLLPGLLVPRVYRWVQGDSSAYSNRDMAAMLAGLGYGSLAFVAVTNAFYTIPPILNPEYAALTDILSRIVR